MKLIVGLGNPGEKYRETRHNIGFIVLDKFLKQYTKVGMDWKENKKFKSELVEIESKKENHNKSASEKIILLRPQTYMNNSGLAVRLITDFYKINSEDIWVIHDEIDLPLGSLKIRLGGASAGHKGVNSIIDSLGTDKFWRFRMGVGHPIKKEMVANRKGKRVDQFVLGGFEDGEKGKSRELVKRVVDALGEALENDLQSAMNRYNF